MMPRLKSGHLIKTMRRELIQILNSVKAGGRSVKMTLHRWIKLRTGTTVLRGMASTKLRSTAQSLLTQIMKSFRIKERTCTNVFRAQKMSSRTLNFKKRSLIASTSIMITQLNSVFNLTKQNMRTSLDLLDHHKLQM